MLTVISPAKRLNETPHLADYAPTVPDFAADALRLAKVARGLSVEQLCALMDISPALGQLNHARFKAFRPDAEGLAAAFTFDGDTYAGLEARQMEPDTLIWAQKHLRILSGLYGLLRPLDAIQPYRLEMGIKLATRRGKDLYGFWGDRIARRLAEDLEGQAERAVVNLASEEYFGAVDRKALGAPVIDVRFEEEKDGERRVLSFFAKQARGRMARWAIDQRIERAADLKGFDASGYRIDAGRSSDQALVFWRPQPPPVAQQRKAG